MGCPGAEGFVVDPKAELCPLANVVLGLFGSFGLRTARNRLEKFHFERDKYT